MTVIPHQPSPTLNWIILASIDLLISPLHRPIRKHHFLQYLHCCIRCRGDMFTEPLSRNGSGIFAYSQLLHSNGCTRYSMLNLRTNYSRFNSALRHGPCHFGGCLVFFFGRDIAIQFNRYLLKEIECNSTMISCNSISVKWSKLLKGTLFWDITPCSLLKVNRSRWYLVLFILPWRLKRYVPPKHRLLSTDYTVLYPRI
jgi:hypothetical protein